MSKDLTQLDMVLWLDVREVPSMFSKTLYHSVEGDRVNLKENRAR